MNVEEEATELAKRWDRALGNTLCRKSCCTEALWWASEQNIARFINGDEAFRETVRGTVVEAEHDAETLVV